MRTAFNTFLSLALIAGLVVVTAARAEDDKKEEKKVTLKGEIGCPKCVFKMDGYKKCANAIKVKEDGKDVIYVFEDKGAAEKYHKECCTEAKKGEVTGVVTKKGDKKTIKPAKDSVKYTE